MTKLDLDLTDEQVASTIAQLQVLPPVPTPAPPPLPPAPPPAPDPVPLPPADVVNPIGPKPTEASTGPRIPLTDVTVPSTGLTLQPGTYQGKNFKGMILPKPGVNLIDCTSWGLRGGIGVQATHCNILGWFGELTNNLDPTLPGFVGKFCKLVGPKDNDEMRIGAASVWGDNTRYMNSLFEDSLLISGFTGKLGSHFDLLQFGGGQNSAFNRVAFLYTNPLFVQDQANNYINNGTKNLGVTITDFWVDGGPVAYVFSGPMKLTRGRVARTTKHFGYVYPSIPQYLPTLVNVYDDAGAPITV